MYVFAKMTVVFAAALLIACGGSSRPATPVETLKAYHLALRNKDTTMMKLLLSRESLKLHSDEAKTRGVTLDEIVREQTLFPAEQNFFPFKNEIIENDKATVEVKNAFGAWDVIYLLREDGAWKIDRKGTAERMIRDIEEKNRKFEETIEKERERSVESPSASPTMDQTDVPDATPPPPSPLKSPESEDNRAKL